MRYKKIMILAIFLVGLLAVGAVNAADNTTDMIGEEPNTNLAVPDMDDVLTADEQTFTQLNQTINGNNNSEITLTSDYKYSNGDDNFKKGIFINRDVTINGNGHTINGSGEARIFYITGGNVVFYNITFVNANADNGYYDGGGAIYGVCRAINCTFKENHVNYNGGAMAWGSAVNCAFFGNSANSAGGAMRGGSAVNCTFSGNTVLFNGGAIAETCAVNCTFTNNSANSAGGAMVYGSAVNCTFTNNSAGYYGGAIYIGSAVNCAFFGNSANKGRAMDTGYKFDCRGTDDFSNTENLELHWEVDNFNSTYGSDKTLPIKLMNQNSYYDDWVWVGFINYDVVIYKNGNKVKTYHCLSNDDLSFDLAAGNYTAELKITYPNLDPIAKNITLTINKATPKIEVSVSDATYPDVVVSVKSDVGGTYIVKVGDKNASVELVAGKARNVIVKGLAVNEAGYVINVTNADIENCTRVVNDTQMVKVKKASTRLSADAVTATYNIDKDFVITLNDANGNPLADVELSVDLNGAKKYTTNANGQVKLSTKGLSPKTYTAKVVFKGNANYTDSSADVKITVKKATPKIKAKKKTFKKSKKVKKYTVILKSGKTPIKKVKLTLKIKGKTYKAKTNKKGKATFKIKKLTKKGKFKAVIKFKGNKYYNKVTKKVKITIK